MHYLFLVFTYAQVLALGHVVQASSLYVCVKGGTVKQRRVRATGVRNGETLHAAPMGPPVHAEHTMYHYVVQCMS